MGAHESTRNRFKMSASIDMTNSILQNSITYSNRLRSSQSEHQLKLKTTSTSLQLDTSDHSTASSNGSSKKLSDSSYLSSTSSSSSSALSSSSSSYRPTIISNRYIDSDTQLYTNSDSCTYCSTQNIKKKNDLNSLTSALMKKLGINTNKSTSNEITSHRGSMVTLRDSNGNADLKRKRFEKNKCVSMFVEAKIDECDEPAPLASISGLNASSTQKSRNFKSKLDRVTSTLKNSFSVFNLKSTNSSSNLNLNRKITNSITSNSLADADSVTKRPLSTKKAPVIVYQNQYVRNQAQSLTDSNCSCTDCKKTTTTHTNNTVISSTISNTNSSIKSIKSSGSTNNKVIIQASTSDLLKCLVIYLNKTFSNFNDFSSNECIQWIRSADKALLIQGWQEIAFINPVNLVFLYLIIRDTLYTHEIHSLHELKTHIFSCMYVAFSYMGNEISYPLKPFIVDNENRFTFWQRIVGILSQMSRSMLRINQETKFFTELFTELKSQSTVILTNNRLSMNFNAKHDLIEQNANNTRNSNMSRINTLPSRPHSTYNLIGNDNQKIPLFVLPSRQLPNYMLQREKTAKV